MGGGSETTREEMVLGARLGYGGKTSRVENRGETTRRETTRGKTSLGETSFYLGDALTWGRVDFTER